MKVENKAYKSKRIVARKSNKEDRNSARKPMGTSDSVVIVLDGWLLREYKDGRVEKIEKLEDTSIH